MSHADAGPATGEPGVDRAQPADAASSFDLVVLGGSAGGLSALANILMRLPSGFPTPVVAMLHLPPDFDLGCFWRRQPLQIKWARAGAVLRPGAMLVCPPRSFVELLPDGTCVLSPCEGGAKEKPIDRLLRSVSRSFGDRALGVVLSGMGNDAAQGALELQRAGGCVLVQAPDSCEHPSMPRSAIAAGAATMVLPLDELGLVIAELVEGTPRQRLRAELEAIGRTFGEQGEVAARALELDWSATALGAVIGWPDELRVMTRMVVESLFPAAVWWGPQLIQLYNDRWRHILGPGQHPLALGAPARQTWAALWEDIGPMVAQVLEVGTSVGRQDYPMLVEREGRPESIFLTFSFAPIRDGAGRVVGVYNTVWETTRDVLAERRLKALRELALQMSGARDVRETCQRAVAALASAPQDAPLALLYLIDAPRGQAALAGAAGTEPGGASAPRFVPLADDAAPWPLSRALARLPAGTAATVQLDDLAWRCPGLQGPASAAAEAMPPCSALLLPVRTAADTDPVAVLVLALNPTRPFDDPYRSFVDLMVEQIAAGIAQARLREQEGERVERLAELDRAKTEFFANVSHEFRTPLTLMLAPLEELLRRREALPAALAEEVDTATRNARRLLTLVTNLLDFSQIESTRQRAYLVPHDLAQLTVDIVSHFRSAVEQAGLRLRVDLAPELPPVPVDPEMWTKVVSNLLSNAFKFTFEGEISVTLKPLRLHAELVVADTGVGIPEDELPHLFKRFHRVRGARARTAEGAGIGLSIVQDLVSRMGGQLQVRSRLAKGSEFRVWMPYKSVRQTGQAPEAVPGVSPVSAAELAAQASRWLPADRANPADVTIDLLGPHADEGDPANASAARPRIVVADDNADMRDFLRRLLSPHWDVTLAVDGEAAFERVRQLRPDVVLADVMMPGVDGFALLKSIRDDPSLQHTPVILVTARAGEEMAIDGLMAGADDYIAKPFSPRELLARVRAVADRGRAEAALRESEARLATELADTQQLHRISKHQIVDDDVEGLYDAILDAAQSLMRSDMASIHCHVPERGQLQLLAHRGFAPQSAAFWSWISADSATSDSVALGNQDAFIVPDVESWDLAAGTEALAHYRLCGIRALLSVPLVSRDGLMVGVMSTHWRQAREPSEREIRLLGVLARQAADLIERRRHEVAARSSGVRYRSLFESLDEGFCTIEMLDDGEGRAVDFRFLEANAAFEQQTGLKNVVGRRMRDLAPQLEQRWFDIYGRVAQTGEPTRFEHRAESLGRWFSVYALRIGDPEQRQVALLFDDITARKRADQSLRASEQRHAFLLELSDALRPLADPVALQAAACRVIGEHLAVDRACYVEIDEKRGEARVRSDYLRGGSASMAGVYRLADYGWSLPILREGRTIAFADLASTPLVPLAGRPALLKMQIVAQVAVPVLEAGALVGCFCVTEPVPREWREEELALVRETAQRTWAAVDLANRTGSAARR